MVNAESFNCFSDLESCYQRDVDFQVLSRATNSSVAILAPHGGKIEPGTSELAKAIAGDDFNLYLFEGLMSSANYACLHLTSTKFDDATCLQLIQACKYVISIHGCKGQEEKVYLGGLDDLLKQKIKNSLESNGFQLEYNHPNYLGSSKRNICNRGQSQAGVQIELTRDLRCSDKRFLFIELMQNILIELN